MNDAATPTQPSKAAIELYNSIMAQVEPDLTTDSLPRLRQTLTNETSEQAGRRGERFYGALKEVERQLSQRKAAFMNAATDTHRAVMTELERGSREHEGQTLDELASQIEQFT